MSVKDDPHVRSMQKALERQFETDADIARTIDAIMAGRFKGTLVAGVPHVTEMKYFDFRRPGILPSKLQDGTSATRFTHEDHVIARQDQGGYNWDRGLVALDRQSLLKMFREGMVVMNGPGHRRHAEQAESSSRHLQEEKREKFRLLRGSMAAGASSGRKRPIKGGKRRSDHSPDGALHAAAGLSVLGAALDTTSHSSGCDTSTSSSSSSFSSDFGSCM